MNSQPRVTLYSRPGCHLCDAAREVVARVCDDLGETWVEVDIESDGDLEDRVGEEIPVTFVDGRQRPSAQVGRPPLRVGLLTCASRPRPRFVLPFTNSYSGGVHARFAGTGKKQL